VLRLGIPPLLSFNIEYHNESLCGMSRAASGRPFFVSEIILGYFSRQTEGALMKSASHSPTSKPHSMPCPFRPSRFLMRHQLLTGV
jgi:hypothetical protein